MRKSNSTRFRPTFEALADRIVPTVAVVNGDIVITGRDEQVLSPNFKIGAPGFDLNPDDTVTVSRVGGLVLSRGKVAFGESYRVVDNGVTTDIPVSRVTGGDVVFNGLGGNDRFENKTSLRALADGGAGSDTLIGGPAGDYMLGNWGEDYLHGNGGADGLFADTDTRFADLSYNYVGGGAGNDYLHGSAGPDFVDGGYGEDYMFAHGGADVMHAANAVADASYNYFNAGDGNDTVYGGAGPDYVDAGAGADKAWGFGGDDRMWGYAGADYLSGGDGNDNLYGGTEIDRLSGGNGLDGLFAGVGDGAEKMYGGAGADRFLLAHGDTAADRTSADARITFRDSPAITGKKFNGQGDTEFSFAAGGWENADIEGVDVSLANLHRHVGNTKLLKTAGGSEMTFLAVGVQTDSNTFRVGGWNGSGLIAVVDPAGKSAMGMNRLVYHEIGHNWDASNENRHVNAFRAVSGWIERDSTPAGYTASIGIGDRWQYLTSAAGTFARNYGKTNPLEDMATTWEAYFVNAYHLGETTMAAQGLTANADKWDTLDDLFIDLRS